MNRFALFSLFLMGCPGDEPTMRPQDKSTQLDQAPIIQAEPVPTNEDPACGALLVDEGCGDEVTFCVEPEQNLPETSETQP